MGGSQHGAATFLRLMSRLAASLDKRDMAGWTVDVHDVQDLLSHQLSLQGDRLLKVQMKRLQDVTRKLQVFFDQKLGHLPFIL